jgi:hypothetical protein
VRPLFFSLVLVFLWCQTPALWAQEGRLQQVREEVRGDDEHAGKKEKTEKAQRGCDNDDDSVGNWLFGEAFGWLFFKACGAPFVLPPALLGDDYRHDGYFLAHPYQHGLPGFMRIEGFLDEGLPPGASPLDPQGLRTWIGRLTLQESNDFRGLNRVNGQVLLDSSSRFGLQTGWTYLTEGLTGGRHDDMVLGDFDVTFRFAQNEYVQMRTGLGARVLADSRSRWGFNFTYGGDFFPAKPLVLSGVVDLGTLGSAGLVHARGTAGVIFRGWEFFTGYDFMRIGSVNLQGPTLGLRFWF